MLLLATKAIEVDGITVYPDHADPDSGQSSLPADRIGQRASGNLGEYSGKTSESEG